MQKNYLKPNKLGIPQGVELTPGQAVGDSGLIGKGLKTLEEKGIWQCVFDR